MSTGLNGKTALVTGGSQGIGKAIALSLASEGVRVGLCARARDRLLSAQEEIEKIGGAGAAYAQGDLTKPHEAEAIVASLLSELGHIDILVNCVGRAKAAPFLDLTDEDWLDAINLKLMAAVRMTRAVLPHMIRAGGGSVIMIGGVFGLQPSPFAIPMGVVNAGLFNFTKALAQDAIRHNVRVNAVAPGRVDTPLFQELVERQMKQTGLDRTQTMAKILGEVPIGRAARPSEIASVVAFLASDAASYVAGEVLTVDGCWTKGL